MIKTCKSSMLTEYICYLCRSGSELSSVYLYLLTPSHNFTLSSTPDAFWPEVSKLPQSQNSHEAVFIINHGQDMKCLKG